METILVCILIRLLLINTIINKIGDFYLSKAKRKYNDRLKRNLEEHAAKIGKIDNGSRIIKIIIIDSRFYYQTKKLSDISMTCIDNAGHDGSAN